MKIQTLLTLRKVSSEPFSMYSVTIITNLPAEEEGGQVSREVTFFQETQCQVFTGRDVNSGLWVFCSPSAWCHPSNGQDWPKDGDVATTQTGTPPSRCC